jgi:hypothetical protein
MISRRRFIYDAALGLVVPFAGQRIIRAAAPVIQTPARGGTVVSGGNGMLTSLYAAFELDEAAANLNATDATGGTAMTRVNDPTIDAAKIGSASRGFNATTNSRRFTRAETGLNGIAAMTVSAWVKTTSAAATQRAVAQDHSGGTRGWLLGLNNTGKPIFAVSDGATLQTATGTTTVNTTNWYLLIGVYDGANVSIYVAREDAGSIGAAEASAALTGNTPSPTSQMTIGCAYTTATSFTNGWTGSIDAVRIWRRALSGANRTFEFNGGSGRAYSEYTS